MVEAVRPRQLWFPVAAFLTMTHLLLLLIVTLTFFPTALWALMLRLTCWLTTVVAAGYQQGTSTFCPI